ncbi:hypothetical protein PR002_g24502 [Phytophthora rubi]|uniref:Retrovirus-related Pol polyprotein from transposon TNT 1-94 n=1 Tax=Phytophthora rubi TaxID=129364 RepID=A0A6A3ICC3_9STRA|nr:hypothetical protein PR002_g24502 [Phytophthora rubi]
MWTYLCNRFDGTVNDQNRALTKRRLYAELEAARCKPNSDLEGHLNSMIRLRTRLQTVGMALDDTVFSGMLVSSLPAGDRFDRLRGLVESGLDCVDTPEKIVEMAITYDKANKADQLLSRAFGSSERAPNPNQQGKPRNGNGGGNGGYKRPGNTKREESQRQREEDRKAGNCFGCHKLGHSRRDCPNEASSGGGQANLSYTGHASVTAGQQAATQKGDAGGASAQSGRQGGPSVGTGGFSSDDGGSAGMQCHASTSTATQQNGYQPESWVYDTGANRHLRKKETVKGYNGTTAPAGVGTIDLWVVVNGGHVAVRLEDVYYSPGRPNLFSQSEARKQGFKVAYDDTKGLYTLSKNLATALQAHLRPCGLWMFTAHNEFLPGERSPLVPEAMVNYALRDGVADLQCWHERLGHLCHQHVRKMVDNDLVDGMMLRKRQFVTCEACQLGKQRAKTPQKMLDRGVTERNQLVFADLLFPPKNYNCTRFNAVLVVMDAYTRFVTVYPVKTKHKDDVNPLIKRYINWAERQCTGCKVKTMFTDGGGEFVNDEMTAWYQSNGITHTATPKNSSRLKRLRPGDDEVLEGEEVRAEDEQLQHTTEPPHASWMDREPPTFNDDIVFSRVQPPFGREAAEASGETEHDRSEEEVPIDEDDSHNDNENDEIGGTESEYGHDDTQINSVIGDDFADGRARDVQNELPPGNVEEQNSIGEEGPASYNEEDEYDAEGASDDGEQYQAEPLHITGHRRSRDDEESVISGQAEPKRTRTGLVYVADGEAEDEELTREFAVYAAIAMVTAKQENPQQRLWHESEVRLPRGVKQATQSTQRKEWWAGMEKEMAAMEAKDVLELVPEEVMPIGKRALETMWRFQFKTDSEGNVVRFRPRLCARGDKQEPEVDFFSMEIYSPVARMASFRLFVALCEILDLDPFQCDVDTAFLNASLKITHYIRRIAGFPIKKGWVYKVKHTLYGLHQSGREWYDELNTWLENHGWSRCASEPCLYVYNKGDVLALLLVYVDDIICGTNYEAWKVSFFAELNARYRIKDQGRLHSYLGVQVELTEEGAFLHQTKYAKDVLRRFGFEVARGCRSPLDPTIKLRAVTEVDKQPGIDYRAAIGSLMYMATGTRPDLAFPVGYLSRFVENPTVQHGGALKRVLRYLVATTDHGIFFKKPKASSLSKVNAIKIEGLVG